MPDTETKQGARDLAILAVMGNYNLIVPDSNVLPATSL